MDYRQHLYAHHGWPARTAHTNEELDLQHSMQHTASWPHTHDAASGELKMKPGFTLYGPQFEGGMVGAKAP